MERCYLPENEMLPRIRMARLYDTKDLDSTKPTPLRTADCFELSLFATSGGVLQVNGEAHAILAGDVRFTRPGCEICSVPHFRCSTVFFHLGPKDKNYTNNFLDSIPGYFGTSGSCKPYFAQLIRYFLSDAPGSKAAQNGLLLQLLYHCYQETHSSAVFSAAVRQCIAFMQENYANRITLQELGQIAGYSPLHLCRLFEADLHCSPHDYLRALRMTQARRLLAETDIPISRLAADCGYTSESYFHTCFKKANGMTAGKYRQTAQIV